MQRTSKAVLVARALALGGILGVGTTTASAQAGGGGAPAARGTYPGSPSNPDDHPYSAPAPKPRVSTWKRFKNFLGNIIGEDTRHSATHKDPFTGRDELPGSKPWMQPSH
jgi:hypothetical protein